MRSNHGAIVSIKDGKAGDIRASLLYIYTDDNNTKQPLR